MIDIASIKSRVDLIIFSILLHLFTRSSMLGFMLEGGIDCRLFQKLNLELDHHNHHLSLHSIEQDACSIFLFAKAWKSDHTQLQDTIIGRYEGRCPFIHNKSVKNLDVD